MSGMRRITKHRDLSESECEGPMKRLYLRDQQAGKHGKLTRTEFVLCKKCNAIFHKPGVAGFEADLLRKGSE